MNDKKVYIAIGAPASGKSTWWDIAWKNGHLSPKQFARINFEKIRLDLLGNEEDYSSEKAVEHIALVNYKQALSNRIKNIYWDHTSHTLKERRILISYAKKAGYKVYAIWFNIPLTSCLERNLKRERVTDIKQLNFIYNHILKNPPDLDEGFDDIIMIEE